MFHFIRSLFSLIGLVVTVGGAVVAFALAREYVRNRLRYVDAVRQPLAPWIVFIGATVVLIPIVGVLSLVGLGLGLGSALVVGGATGAGTASGVKALKRGE